MVIISKENFYLYNIHEMYIHASWINYYVNINEQTVNPLKASIKFSSKLNNKIYKKMIKAQIRIIDGISTPISGTTLKPIRNESLEKRFTISSPTTDRKFSVCCSKELFGFDGGTSCEHCNEGAAHEMV